MSGDFAYVSRTKKNRRKRPGRSVPPTLESLNERLEAIHSQFVASDVCVRCLDAIRRIWKENSLSDRIICLGLGSLSDGTSTRISLVQLALLLELKRLLDDLSTETITITAYDPIFTTLDIEFLTSRGLTVENVADEHNKSMIAKTLFYLPHCDQSTNEAVISNMLSTNSLSNTIILGNDLRSYGHILSDSIFEQKSPNIFRVVKDDILEWENLEPKQGEEHWDAFSDLCLMWSRNSGTQIEQLRE